MHYAKPFNLPVVFFALLTIIGISCQKDNTKSKLQTVKTTTLSDTVSTKLKTDSAGIVKTARAIVLDYHPVAADGCGFLIKVDSVLYHADNLPQEFEKDSLVVDINYDLLGTKFQCGMTPNSGPQIIHLVDIKMAVKPQTVEGLVFYSGPVAADGCDWLIKVGSNEYHSDNLPELFKKDSLKVNINYNLLTTRFYCGMLANSPGLPVIRINYIEKK